MADPTAVHAYVELADIYRNHSDLDKAEKVLAKGRKANPDDHGLASIYEDTQIARLKKGQRQPAAARAAVCRGHRRQGQARPVERNAQQVRGRGVPPARAASPGRPEACISTWA